MLILLFNLIIFNMFNFEETSVQEPPTKIATFGGGCFWCTEAVFESLKGVSQVTSGFSGGKIKNPSYKEVVNGKTGHAEVVQVQYNPEEISFYELLEVFFATHDPTTLNRQGADVGTHYRSIILYHDDFQRQESEEYIQWMENEKIFENKIVTEIKSFEAFYPAGEEHQDFYRQNPQVMYCTYVIDPKLGKLRKYFQDRLK
jgi:peptide-methionine (S)-S-oxide reductase